MQKILRPLLVFESPFSWYLVPSAKMEGLLVIKRWHGAGARCKSHAAPVMGGGSQRGASARPASAWPVTPRGLPQHHQPAASTRLALHSKCRVLQGKQMCSNASKFSFCNIIWIYTRHIKNGANFFWKTKKYQLFFVCLHFSKCSCIFQD